MIRYSYYLKHIRVCVCVFVSLSTLKSHVRANVNQGLIGAVNFPRDFFALGKIH